MTDAEKYLQSERAREDVATTLERYRAGTDKTTDRWIIASGVISDKSNPWLMAFCMGAHGEADEESIPTEPKIVYPTHNVVPAYFRQEGDCFIVSDLGEGMHALRLRTGLAEVPEQIGRDLMQLAPSGGVSMNCAAEFVWMVRAAADDLPDAICRVLLASWRVANLEVRAS